MERERRQLDGDGQRRSRTRRSLRAPTANAAVTRTVDSGWVCGLVPNCGGTGIPCAAVLKLMSMKRLSCTCSRWVLRCNYRRLLSDASTDSGGPVATATATNLPRTTCYFCTCPADARNTPLRQKQHKPKWLRSKKLKQHEYVRVARIELRRLFQRERKPQLAQPDTQVPAIWGRGPDLW